MLKRGSEVSLVCAPPLIRIGNEENFGNGKTETHPRQNCSKCQWSAHQSSVARGKLRAQRRANVHECAVDRAVPRPSHSLGKRRQMGGGRWVVGVAALSRPVVAPLSLCCMCTIRVGGKTRGVLKKSVLLECHKKPKRPKSKPNFSKFFPFG